MCEITGVSRSGYYNWVDSAEKRAEKEAQDRADFELILEAYNYRSFKKGSRSIFMRLLRNGHPMSRNKIRRLMKKYNLFCPIRKANPYTQMAKALEENSVAPNLLKRDFKGKGVYFG